MKPSLRLLALLAGLLAAGCPAPAQDAQLKLKILRGDLDPLVDPGNAERVGSPVGALELVWKGAAGEPERASLDPSGPAAQSVHLAASPGTGVLSVLGRRAVDGAVYSFGRTLPLALAEGDTAEATLFLAPAEAFTPVGPPLPGNRMAAAVAALGETGALIAGGFERTASEVLASPAVVVYRRAEGRACGHAEGCLSGAEPPPRRDGIAVRLPDGSVAHGLGALAGGELDATLYLTTPDGRTEALALDGDPLPGLRGPGAVALSNGDLLLLGGGTASGAASADVLRVDLRARTVTRLADGLREARELPGAAVLAADQVLVLGGTAGGTARLTAELYEAGAGSRWVDGGVFGAARAQLQGPRVGPAVARLADDSVVVAGGGTSSLEVFRVDLGMVVGGFIDMAAPPGAEDLVAPALARLRSGELLIAGGESAGSAQGVALIFTPDPNHVPDSSSPNYLGEYRRSGGSATPRGAPALVELADGTVLLAGGGASGALSPEQPNAAATRLELMVPGPVE